MKKIIFASAIILGTLTATAQRTKTTTTKTGRTNTTTTTVSRTSDYSSAGSTGLANTVLLYGNVGLLRTSDGADDPEKFSRFEFSPGIGYQFNNNWAVGLQASIISEKETIDPVQNDFAHTNEFQVGPFLRYTQSLGNIFNVYGQLDLGFRGTREKEDGVDGVDKSAGILGRITPAISINVKNNFMLNFNIGGISYVTDKPDVDNADTESEFDFNFGRTINIGISKNF